MYKRKKRPLVPAGIPAKKCPGPLCQGQPRPLREEVWRFYKTGRDAGKPHSYCRECETAKQLQYQARSRRRNPEMWQKRSQQRSLRLSKRKRQYSGLVSREKVQGIVERLCDRLGACEVARRIDVTPDTVWRWRTCKVTLIQKELAVRLLFLFRDVLANDERLTPLERRIGKNKRIVVEKGERGLFKSWRVEDAL